MSSEENGAAVPESPTMTRSIPRARDDSGRLLLWLSLVTKEGVLLGRSEVAAAPSRDDLFVLPGDTGASVTFVVLTVTHRMEQAADGEAAHHVVALVQESSRWMREKALARRYRQ